MRLRDFEVPMSGGFYLVEAMEELADFFVPGREIETYAFARKKCWTKSGITSRVKTSAR